MEMEPSAHWVLVSVPGRFAADVARQALEGGRNVFLYSDNVTLDEEVALKQSAGERGLMVMGPDCGTAIVQGVGLGFANRVRTGPIGLVAASGTGLQAVSTYIHSMGSGITHALGTGGRDLSEEVGAVTARQAFDLLDRDSETAVVVLISKPPSPNVADDLIRVAKSSTKPVVVDFIGYTPATRRIGNVHFASSFSEAAAMAVDLANAGAVEDAQPVMAEVSFDPSQRYLRGLYSGGTLAYEALLILQDYLPAVYSNIPLRKELRLEDSMESLEHSILDLWEDEFTVGRLHPMMDNDLRIRRMEKEAADPEVAVILLDVVLGYGAHPDPASELALAIEAARQAATEAGRSLQVVAVVVGTDEDPQDLQGQIQQLEAAGAHVETSNEDAVRLVGQLVAVLGDKRAVEEMKPVDPGVLADPFSAINVGLESFSESLTAQETPVLQVDWRPPAVGNEKLMSILERMK
jgi:FdrA protein